MTVTIYLYHNLLPKHETFLKRCEKCNRPLFKYSADEMVISNSGLLGYMLYEPGTHWIEHICHSCGTVYNVLYM